ncbi:MAG: hypothetical protein ACRCTA_04265, partial [Bacilli bacterium]
MNINIKLYNLAYRTTITMMVLVIILLPKNQWYLFGIVFYGAFISIYALLKKVNLVFSKSDYTISIICTLVSTVILVVVDLIDINLISLKTLFVLLSYGLSSLVCFSAIRISYYKNIKIKQYNIKYIPLLIFTILMINSLMYLFSYQPGVITADTVHQICQGVYCDKLVYSTYVNHHPILMTIILEYSMKIGRLIGFGNYGIMFYTICQVIFYNFTFAYLLNYLRKVIKNDNIILILIGILLFSPPLGIYAITIWKDV